MHSVSYPGGWTVLRTKYSTRRAAPPARVPSRTFVVYAECHSSAVRGRYTEARDELDETRADYGDLKLQHKLALQQLEEMADELDKMRQKYGHAR